jgi:hypothetical protein
MRTWRFTSTLACPSTSRLSALPPSTSRLLLPSISQSLPSRSTSAPIQSSEISSPCAVAIRTYAAKSSSNKKKSPVVLVTGGLGQIGTELIPLLRSKYGPNNVIATDVRKTELPPPFYYLDILKISEMERLVVENNVDWLIHNARYLFFTYSQLPVTI